ncbi:hypothetical protein BKA63DRAFT_493656 [Paraphoma chrysanthemicola]|nr:hypothetical protein BKA63DRAFT_493656 [Paraphoma chrysanthemicola]
MKALLTLLAATSFIGSTCSRAPHSSMTPARDSGSVILETKLHGLHNSIDDRPSPYPDTVQTAGEKWNPANTASQAEWDRFRQKGNWLGCMTRATDEEAGKMWPDPLNRTPKSARSQWQGDLKTELATWGWLDTVYDQKDACEFRDDEAGTAHHIGTALQALGLSETPKILGGNIQGYSIEHGEETFDEPDSDDSDEEPTIWDVTYMVGDREYHSTGARIRFGMDGAGGAIYAQDFESPRSAADGNWPYVPPNNELPALHLASDVLWGYWVRQNPAPFRYYFAMYVQNEETLRLMASIFTQLDLPDIPKWPGIELPTTGPKAAAGEAILGSPIGATLAYFLIQHKAELGLRHVTSVTIFQDNWFYKGAQHIHLMYKVEEFQEPEPGLSVANTAVFARSVNARDNGSLMIREHVFQMDAEKLKAKL